MPGSLCSSDLRSVFSQPWREAHPEGLLWSSSVVPGAVITSAWSLVGLLAWVPLCLMLAWLLQPERGCSHVTHCPLLRHVSHDFLVRGHVGLRKRHCSKASADAGVPAELFQILKDDAVKGLHSMCQPNVENSAVATGLEKVSFLSNPKERQCQRMLKLPQNCTHLTRY